MFIKELKTKGLAVGDYYGFAYSMGYNFMGRLDAHVAPCKVHWDGGRCYSIPKTSRGKKKALTYYTKLYDSMDDAILSYEHCIERHIVSMVQHDPLAGSIDNALGKLRKNHTFVGEMPIVRLKIRDILKTSLIK